MERSGIKLEAPPEICYDNPTEVLSMNYTYIVTCSDGSLYTGWTNDLTRRLKAHNEGKGAKYTKSRRPVVLAYYEEFSTKEEAMRREWEIKHMTRQEKMRMIPSLFFMLSGRHFPERDKLILLHQPQTFYNDHDEVLYVCDNRCSSKTSAVQQFVDNKFVSIHSV